MHDSKSQQQRKSLKVTRNATTGHKHMNEAYKQVFTNKLLKKLSKYTLGMFSNRKICFNALNIRHCDEFCVV